MAMLEPDVAILDRADSGLDATALRIVPGIRKSAASAGARHLGS